MEFFDTHAHLDFPDFAADLPQVVTRAEAAGISRIISIGTDLASSRQAVALSERFPKVYAVVGWHPCHASEAPQDFRPELRELARHPKVVAIGETGLDHHHLPSENPSCTAADDDRYKDRQAQIFQQQLEVAAELGLNCVIHQRNAFDATLDQLRPFASKVRGVFHCFGNPPDDMRRILELGSIVSFTGILTFKNAQTVRDSLAAAPPDGFMLETDCPYLAPIPYRGKRCEPAYVREIATLAARVRQCSIEDLSRMTCATARSFFPKMT
ncbi:MAG: TatD family deoxyribonuclease [Pedosphaera sp.]|nr:TatD family deoxyribonuclease [Pedosphaera sp.]